MIHCVLYLTYIYFRKFFKKKDFLTLFAIIFVLFCLFLKIYKEYNTYRYFLFLFLFSIAGHHFNRKDLNWLKKHPNWRTLIILEYALTSAPIFIIFLLKKDFLLCVIFALCVAGIAFLAQKNLKIRYPFLLFDPFWVICFRKYKLLLWLPIGLSLVFLGKTHHNPNLVVFSLLITSIIGAIPSFEREHRWHLISSEFTEKQYLIKQLKINILNYFIFSILINLLAIFTFADTFPYVVLSFFVPTIGVYTKYCCFKNLLRQSIVFSLLICALPYAFPIVFLPLLHYFSVKEIKKIKYVTNSYPREKI